MALSIPNVLERLNIHLFCHYIVATGSASHSCILNAKVMIAIGIILITERSCLVFYY